MELRDIITKDVASVKPDTLLNDAAKMMVRKNISSIVAVDGDVALGIISERDFVRFFLDGGDHSATKVSDVMSSPVITADINLSIMEALELIKNEGIRRLPITENGKLAGIITETDIVKALRTTPAPTGTIIRKVKFSKN